jgi:hypothetical protein
MSSTMIDAPHQVMGILLQDFVLKFLHIGSSAPPLKRAHFKSEELRICTKFVLDRWAQN